MLWAKSGFAIHRTYILAFYFEPFFAGSSFCKPSSYISYLLLNLARRLFHTLFYEQKKETIMPVYISINNSSVDSESLLSRVIKPVIIKKTFVTEKKCNSGREVRYVLPHPLPRQVKQTFLYEYLSCVKCQK